MTETPTDTDTSTVGSRLRERIGSISPFSLMILGFVGFLGDAFSQLEILTLFHLFWLFGFWPLATMLVGAVKQLLGDEQDNTGPRDWLEIDTGWKGDLAFLTGLPLSILNPHMFRQGAMQQLGSIVAVVRNRGSLPGPKADTQSVTYRLPVEGTWTVVSGSPIKEHSHSWFPATQRYAYDFVITDEEGRSRPAGTDTNIENYYCYDQPVVAPADGTVVDVGDGDPELGRAGGFSHPLKRSLTGNYVTIRHAEGEYSSLVHLVPGSVAVEPGEWVERGEQIGRCGHSGNSAEPHLHFQVQDHPTFEIAAGVPVRFDDVAIEIPGTDVVETTGWDVPESEDTGRYIHVGQRVAHAPDAESSRNNIGTEIPETTAIPNFTGVITFGAVAKGLSVGGIVTVLAGFVVSSLTTIALGLVGIAGLAVAYQVSRHLLASDRLRFKSIVMAGGAGLAAVVVGAFGASNALSELGSSPIGAGIFVTGFLLYIAIWEYGRQYLFQDDVPIDGTV